MEAVNTIPQKTRILHAAVDTAWQGTLLSQALRESGYQSRSFSRIHTSWGLQPDIQASYTSAPLWQHLLLQPLSFLRELPEFDLLHVHYGESLLYLNLDIPIVSNLGKKTVFHFHGSDVRLQSTERRIRDSSFTAEGNPSWYCNWSRARKMNIAKKYGSNIIVSTPDLLDVIPDALHLPVALPFKQLARRRDTNRGLEKLRIAHSPTDPQFKGTKYLRSAVAQLREEGVPIELDIIHEVPHEQALERMGAADVFVDQLGCGWYGLAAVEAMAMGVPTMCYIRDDLAHHLSPLPFIVARKDNVARVLQDIWQNQDELSAYSRAGEVFVEKWHEPRRVAERLVAIYGRALRGV